MSCDTRLGAYLDGELAAAERADVEAHLGGCAACAEELRRIAAASAAVKAWRPGRRGFHGLPLFATAAALLVAVWALAPRGPAPRPGVLSLRAGEAVRHTGAREYLAEGLARPARIDCLGGAVSASNAGFRLEDSMRTGTKVGAAVAATAAVVIWGSIEWTDRAGHRATLGEGTHELRPPDTAAAESEGASGAVAAEPPGDPFEAVTGVVLMPDGAPAPEAAVALTYPSQWAGMAPDQTTVSDADGRFRFASAAKPFMLAAAKARVGAVSGYFTPGAHVVLKLRAGALVEGRLIDEVDGSAVADALVSSQMTGGVWGHARAVTGADGRFVLDGLDPDGSTLWIRPKAHLDLVVLPRLARGETVSLELRLARSVALRGQVVDGTTGAPVALTAVEVSSNPQRAARLLGDGRFEVMSQRWGTSIVVHAEGYPDTAFSFGTAFQAQGDPARGQVFKIDRGALLRLRARDETDRPIAGVRVTLIRTGSYWGDLVTAEDGDVAARLPSGQDAWLALGQHPRYTFEQTPVQPGRGGETVVPLLGRAAGTVLGRVVAKDGRPAAGARIDVGQSQAYALEDGRFRLDSLAPGRVEIRALGADGAASIEADLRPHEVTDVGDVVLRSAATITGSVTRPDGSRIERYEVWAAGKGGTVEADGTFRVAGIEEGRAYEVNVRAGGVTKAVADVLAGTQGLEIRLDDYATIKGRVLVPEGDAVPLGLSMGCARVGSEKPVFCDTRVYMDGGFVIAGVPAGRYAVSASAEASSYARTVATVEVKAGATAEVDLRLVRGGTVEGRLASPLPPEKVMVRLESADPESTRVAVARDGAFLFQALAPGDYTVEAQTYEAGYRGTKQSIVVRAGETARCDLAVVATGGLLVRAPAGTPLSLLDAAGNPVEPAAAERRDLTRQLWEARGRPGKEARAELEADVERALLAADADGVWRRAALFPGQYFVASGERRERIVLRAGETTELDLR